MVFSLLSASGAYLDLNLAIACSQVTEEFISILACSRPVLNPVWPVWLLDGVVPGQCGSLDMSASWWPTRLEDAPLPSVPQSPALGFLTLWVPAICKSVVNQMESCTMSPVTSFSLSLKATAASAYRSGAGLSAGQGQWVRKP